MLKIIEQLCYLRSCECHGSCDCCAHRNLFWIFSFLFLGWEFHQGNYEILKKIALFGGYLTAILLILWLGGLIMKRIMMKLAWAAGVLGLVWTIWELIKNREKNIVGKAQKMINEFIKGMPDDE